MVAKNKYRKNIAKKLKAQAKAVVKKAQRTPLERAWDKYRTCAGYISSTIPYLKKKKDILEQRKENKQLQLYAHWKKLKDETTIQTA